jgi:hypothetical protein
MTIQQLFQQLEQYPIILISFFAGIPLLVLLTRLIHGKYKAELKPWKYFYSVYIYLVSIPGIFVLFITLYLLIFPGNNFTQLSIVTYILPIVSMFLTLIVIRKIIDFDDIPGFKKLYGLFLFIAFSFIILLILDRLRIYLFFAGSIWIFAALFIGIFVVLRLSIYFIFGGFRKRKKIQY